MEQALTDYISLAFHSGVGWHISATRQLHDREAARAAEAAASVLVTAAAKVAATAAGVNAGQFVPPIVMVSALLSATAEPRWERGGRGGRIGVGGIGRCSTLDR